MSGVSCDALVKGGSRRSKRRRAKKRRTRRVKRRVRRRRIKDKQLEYCIMIKRAIYRTQKNTGTTREKIIKYIKKRFKVNKKSVNCCVRKYLPGMIKRGFVYRSKTNPLLLKVTLKGKNMRSLLLKRYRKKKASRRRRRTVKRRKAKRRQVC